mmetsp:Transcript_12872/g.31257  ORF Transcript_12872/g.31257 Transcript_12872/m.31257 type:complete len:200 (+) Transcript_12872:574-1173(+)
MERRRGRRAAGLALTRRKLGLPAVGLAASPTSTKSDASGRAPDIGAVAIATAASTAVRSVDATAGGAAGAAGAGAAGAGETECGGGHVWVPPAWMSSNWCLTLGDGARDGTTAAPVLLGVDPGVDLGGGIACVPPIPSNPPSISISSRSPRGLIRSPRGDAASSSASCCSRPCCCGVCRVSSSSPSSSSGGDHACVPPT